MIIRTFDDLCRQFRCSPQERLKLWHYLAFIRLRAMLLRELADYYKQVKP